MRSAGGLGVAALLWIAEYPLDSTLPDSIPRYFTLNIDAEDSEKEVLKGGNKILAERDH